MADKEVLSDSKDTKMTTRQKEKSAVKLEDIEMNNVQMDHEISLLIEQWLLTRSYTLTAQTMKEEVLVASTEKIGVVKEIERGLLDGEYSLIEGLLGDSGLKPQTQRAFIKRLKPLEHYQPYPYDFYNLSYLTSASTVHDAPAFRDWKGVQREREGLVNMWHELTEKGDGNREKIHIPPHRLETLLRQAAAWQIEHSPRTSKPTITDTSLLRDYQPLILPDTLHLLIHGHQANIKCISPISPYLAVSGSSDRTLRIFSIVDGLTRHTLSGHTSRIWDCSTTLGGETVVSASGDGSLRVWDVENGRCKSVMQGQGGDVYSVRWRPGHNQVVSASYDKILHCWDVETSRQIRTFSGHSMSAQAVTYDPTGNIIASGSKDKHIRLWDAVGGVCTHTLTDCLGEITSIQFDGEGKYLLAGCKDNSNRLYDMRMRRNLYRYIGHQNTSKNLIRCSFNINSTLVLSGSEDGNVYIWERESSSSSIPLHLSSSIIPPNVPLGDQVNEPTNPTNPPTGSMIIPSTRPFRGDGDKTITVRPAKVLKAHEGTVYDVKWIESGGRLLSCGEDGSVGVWGHEV
ncbi:hypothetical protein M231_01719 [Tremella mesenterica]|uniref:WD40 repeat-containing protein SMU1 n=1 Tax=Tremella mesenterica TaxID=5217 RepID=A0A4Q1BSZ0_TREME|nr:hypothetical protein M231_01719 [Tremella mesenterica]